MEFVVIVGVIALVLLYLVVRRYVFCSRIFYSIPYNPGWLPFLGTVPNFAWDPVSFLKSCFPNAESSCPVHQFLLAGLNITLIHDPSNHGFFFLRNDSDLSFRDAYVNMFESVVGEDAFSVGVPVKDLFKPGMSSAKSALFDALIEREITDFNTRLFMQDHVDPKTGACDLFKAWGHLVLLTTSRCLVGKEVHEQKGLMDKLHDLEDGFNVIGLFFPGLPLPALTKRRQARDSILSSFMQIIQKRREEMAASNRHVDDGPEDMLTVLLAHQKDFKLEDKNIAGLLLSFIFVGQVQTFAAAAWTILYLLERPDLKKQVLLEIDAKYPHAVPQMELLERCIRESVRLSSPVLMFRKIMVDNLTVHLGSGSFKLPKDSLLAVSPVLIHRDERIYKDADSYLPDRFSPGSDLYNKIPFSFVGFGGGRHSCLGEFFAYQECKHMIAQLLRDFDLKLVQRVPKPNFKHMGGLVIPERPCPVFVKRRV
eukprot:ANDGO_06940.mRNA.1 Sterol 14-demethylase